MAKQLFQIIILLAVFGSLLGAGLVAAAPANWDRYAQRGGERLVPGASPDNRGGAGGGSRNPAAQYSEPQDNARRQAGRLSPEERRNLRRQINEAGQDIYIPRR
ncbi:hypothetical protein [Lacisediminimonas profundi]|uniref:hypothetical protein n=1 Tax=Lacisediminimonas profundi TaxID=2603856 RepID=UPI001F4F638E|nr:hypothetical protein [Lacisediminimonas profundi]